MSGESGGVEKQDASESRSTTLSPPTLEAPVLAVCAPQASVGSSTRAVETSHEAVLKQLTASSGVAPVKSLSEPAYSRSGSHTRITPTRRVSGSWSPPRGGPDAVSLLDKPRRSSTPDRLPPLSRQLPPLSRGSEASGGPRSVQGTTTAPAPATASTASTTAVESFGPSHASSHHSSASVSGPSSGSGSGPRHSTGLQGTAEAILVQPKRSPSTSTTLPPLGTRALNMSADGLHAVSTDGLSPASASGRLTIDDAPHGRYPGPEPGSEPGSKAGPGSGADSGSIGDESSGRAKEGGEPVSVDVGSKQGASGRVVVPGLPHLGDGGVEAIGEAKAGPTAASIVTGAAKKRRKSEYEAAIKSARDAISGVERTARDSFDDAKANESDIYRMARFLSMMGLNLTPGEIAHLVQLERKRVKQDLQDRDNAAGAGAARPATRRSSVHAMTRRPSNAHRRKPVNVSLEPGAMDLLEVLGPMSSVIADPSLGDLKGCFCGLQSAQNDPASIASIWSVHLRTQRLISMFLASAIVDLAIFFVSWAFGHTTDEHKDSNEPPAVHLGLALLATVVGVIIANCPMRAVERVLMIAIPIVWAAIIVVLPIILWFSLGAGGFMGAIWLVLLIVVAWHIHPYVEPDVGTVWGHHLETERTTWKCGASAWFKPHFGARGVLLSPHCYLLCKRPPPTWKSSPWHYAGTGVAGLPELQAVALEQTFGKGITRRQDNLVIISVRNQLHMLRSKQRDEKYLIRFQKSETEVMQYVYDPVVFAAVSASKKWRGTIASEEEVALAAYVKKSLVDRVGWLTRLSTQMTIAAASKQGSKRFADMLEKHQSVEVAVKPAPK